MESVLTIVPPSFSASRSASADLPLAVGPAIRMAAGLRIRSPPAALIQPPRRRLRNSLLDQRGDRTSLMMGQPPGAVDAFEQVGRGQRRAADELHADHTGLVARDHHGLVARVDPVL